MVQLLVHCVSLVSSKARMVRRRAQLVLSLLLADLGSIELGAVAALEDDLVPGDDLEEYATIIAQEGRE